jgi:hypothetical protein
MTNDDADDLASLIHKAILQAEACDLGDVSSILRLAELELEKLCAEARGKIVPRELPRMTSKQRID